MGLGGELSETQNGASGVGSPVGGKQAGQSGDKHHAGRVVDLGGKLSNLLGRLNETNVVSQPLDARAGDGDGALQSVDGLLALEVVADGGQQAVVGDDGLLAGVVEQEAAGSICVLGLAGLKGLLADEGGGLVTETAGQGDVGEGAGSDSAVDLGGRDNLGENELLDAKELDELLVVLEGLNVHEHGPGGVGGVGDVGAAVEAAREVVEQPRVDGGEGQLASIVALSGLLDVIQDPSDLDSGKVGGQGQATELGDLVSAGLGLELLDGVAGSGVGPHNGVVQGLAGLNVPKHGGFSLVGDSDRLHVGHLDALGSHFLGNRRHALQTRAHELLGVVLHPSGVGVDLGEFDLVGCHGLAVRRKENETGGGGTLVESSYVGRHVVGFVVGLVVGFKVGCGGKKKVPWCRGDRYIYSWDSGGTQTQTDHHTTPQKETQNQSHTNTQEGLASDVKEVKEVKEVKKEGLWGSREGGGGGRRKEMRRRGGTPDLVHFGDGGDPVESYTDAKVPTQSINQQQIQ